MSKARTQSIRIALSKPMKLIARHPIWMALVAFFLYAMFVVPNLLMMESAVPMVGLTLICALFTAVIIFGARSSTKATDAKRPTSPRANRSWTVIRRPGGEGRP
jgi:hypothetical protein